MPPINEGTARLCRDYLPESPILDEEVQRRAREAANTPEANAKKAEAKRGKPPHPNTRAALAKVRKRPRSPEHRRKIGAAMKRLGVRPADGAAL